MNLTKLHKEAIVKAVVLDIPKPKSRDIQERLQKVIDEDIAKYAPPSLADMWADKELCGYVNSSSSNPGYLKPNGWYSTYVTSSVRRPINVNAGRGSYQLSEKGLKKFLDLFDAAEAELEAIEETKTKLKAALEGIRTRRQFLEQFPELEKYAPIEPEKGRMLPAISNVMADLAKLGWPEKKEAVTA